MSVLLMNNKHSTVSYFNDSWTRKANGKSLEKKEKQAGDVFQFLIATPTFYQKRFSKSEMKLPEISSSSAPAPETAELREITSTTAFKRTIRIPSTQEVGTETLSEK
jgi:hypothetical protein